MNLSKRIQIPFRIILGTTTMGLLLLALYEISQQLISLGVVFSLRTFWWRFILSAFVIAVPGLLFVWSRLFREVKVRFVRFYDEHLLKQDKLLPVLFILVSLGFLLWVLKAGYIVLNGYKTRLFLFMMVSILGMICLRPLVPGKNWKTALFGAMLITTALFKTLIYIFQGISTSPFSLSWSEGSRYYYGSLYFSERLYGMDLSLSPLHPSRYMLMALPFVFPNLPIWAHRTWQVLLWIGLGGLTGVALSKRLWIKKGILFILFSTWVYLFLNLGPVYYHLLICVILVYLGTDFTKPRQTLVVLLLASIWAGLSRINWVPIPTFLTVSLYFLERSLKKTDKVWRYLLQPVTWGAGIFTAFAAYILYIPLSGNQTSKFGSTFSSDLLWNRLLPNPTYPFGILFSAIVMTIPLWLVIYTRFRQRSYKMHPIKLLGYSAMILTLFLGGLIVSVKIGGGSNLHNMDAYLVLLMTIAGFVFWRTGEDDQRVGISPHLRDSVPGWITAAAILIPVLFILREGGVIFLPDYLKDQQDLSTLQSVVSSVSDRGGEVLFISERQLQVFNFVPKVPFVPEYEKIILMEMAMAGDQAYLAQFYKDITSRRFDLIITDSVRTDRRDEIDAFSEEHNVWVDHVMIPLLGNYTFRSLGGRSSIFILTPKE
jgi:hypothetical protein